VTIQAIGAGFFFWMACREIGIRRLAWLLLSISAACVALLRAARPVIHHSDLATALQAGAFLVLVWGVAMEFRQ